MYAIHSGCAYECPAGDDMCLKGTASSTCCICFCQVPDALLSDEIVWVWAGRKAPLARRVELGDGVHDSMVLATSSSVTDARVNLAVTCRRGFVGCAVLPNGCRSELVGVLEDPHCLQETTSHVKLPGSYHHHLRLLGSEGQGSL